MTTPFLWIFAIAALYALHQDLWFWRSARPLVGGFLPIGLMYHVLYCLAASGLMWALTTYAWPLHLESLDRERAGRADRSRNEDKRR